MILSPNIIVTAGYPELAQKIQRVTNDLHLNVYVVEGILHEAAHEVKNAVDTGEYEVIVSRAGTAKVISELVDLPIVHSDSDHFDILTGIKKAKKFGDKIGLITYPEEGFTFNFAEIKSMLDFDIEIFPYKTSEELIEQMKLAKEKEMDVIVGGGIRAANVANSYGIKAVNLSISERSIKRILLLANKVANDRIALKEEAVRLHTVINASEEGIIFLDDQNVVKSCNEAVKSIFNVNIDDLIGENVKDIDHSSLKSILKKMNEYEKAGNYTTGNLNISYDPIVTEGKRIGTVVTIRKVSQIQKLETKIRQDLHKKGLLAKYTFQDIVHQSDKMENVVSLAKDYAQTDSTILIIGESGTGKELLAQGIHNASERKNRPFVAINCAALPENLLESELFGYEEGAFTGASKGGKQGVFELAHGGTIFLDEIGEIPAHIQTHLLRVLQEKEVMRIGGEQVIPVDIRVVAATNRKLWHLVQEKKFRLDLYFRLSVLHLELPTLYERKEDIPIFVDYFLKRINSAKRYKDFSEELKQFFMSYRWPGNVRQLENIIERYHLSVHDKSMETEFYKDILRETEYEDELDLLESPITVESGTMKDMQIQIIKRLLEKHDGNRSQVAEELGISRTTLWKWLNE